MKQDTGSKAPRRPDFCRAAGGFLVCQLTANPAEASLAGEKINRLLKVRVVK